MDRLHAGISLRKGTSPVLNIGASTHKLLVLPEWDSTVDQKILGTTPTVFPVPLSPALCTLAQHPVSSPSKITTESF